MYYSININQIAIATHNKNFATNLDLIDGAIIVYLAQQSVSVFAKKHFIVYENEVYYRICYDNIISQLPLINIENKEVIGRRIKKLEKAGVIKFYLDKKNNNKTYFTTTELFENFVSKVPTQKSVVEDLKVGTQPTQKSCHIYDNDTNDNNINYSKEKTNKKEIPVSANFTHTQPVVKESLTVEPTCKENLQVESVKVEVVEKIKRFQKPTIAEILEYANDLCKKENIKLANLTVEMQNLFDFYEQKDWKVGNTKMKEWKLAVNRWVRANAVKEQAKQQNLSGQKLIQKPVYEVNEEDKKKQEQELKEYANVKTEEPQFMEHFKSVLKNHYSGVYTSIFDGLKMKSINTNEVVFILPNQVSINVIQKNKEKFEQVFKRELQGFDGKEFAGEVNCVAWKI